MRHDNSDSLYYRPTEGNGTRPLKLFFVFFFRLVKRETGKSEMPSSLAGAMESENENEASTMNVEISLPFIEHTNFRSSDFLHGGIHVISRGTNSR